MNDMTMPTVREIRSDRIRCSLFFLAGGIGIGSWAACLPALAAQAGLDKGMLGLVLLCFALGAILMMTNVGRLSARISPSTLSLSGSIVFAAALAIVPHVEGTGWLALTVLLGGAGFGTLDVSMNIEASYLERLLGRPMMSSFHGVFSVGNLVGAFIVGWILQGGGTLAACLGATGVGVAVLAGAAATGASRAVRTTAPGDAAGKAGGPIEAARRPVVLLLGALAFLSMMAEGGMLDWSAIYLVSVGGATESTAAYGFAIFASAMAVGRLVGDPIVHRMGPMGLLQLSGLTCVASIAVLLAVGNLPTMFLALAVCGLGVANLVPVLFAAAGRAGGGAAARSMSTVTTMGYAGLLLGPALLGFIAQATALQASFGVVLAAFLVVAAAAWKLRAGFRSEGQNIVL